MDAGIRQHRALSACVVAGRERRGTPSEEAHGQIRPIRLLLPEALVPFGSFERTMIVNLHEQRRGHTLLHGCAVTEGFAERAAPRHSADVKLFHSGIVGTRSLMEMIRGAVASAEQAMNVNYGGVTIIVYGREGQDIRALADEIEERLTFSAEKRRAAFA